MALASVEFTARASVLSRMLPGDACIGQRVAAELPAVSWQTSRKNRHDVRSKDEEWGMAGMQAAQQRAPKESESSWRCLVPQQSLRLCMRVDVLFALSALQCACHQQWIA
jgi:hypothetical protein